MPTKENVLIYDNFIFDYEECVFCQKCMKKIYDQKCDLYCNEEESDLDCGKCLFIKQMQYEYVVSHMGNDITEDSLPQFEQNISVQLPDRLLDPIKFNSNLSNVFNRGEFKTMSMKDTLTYLNIFSGDYNYNYDDPFDIDNPDNWDGDEMIGFR